MDTGDKVALAIAGIGIVVWVSGILSVSSWLYQCSPATSAARVKQLERSWAVPIGISKAIWNWYWDAHYDTSRVKFDRDKWILAAKKDGDLRIRYRMVASLTEQYKLVGMSEDDAVVLLGTDFDHSWGMNDLCYSLGTIQGARKWLCLSVSDQHIIGFKVKEIDD